VLKVSERIRKYLVNVLLILLAWVIFFASLWQLEIVQIQAWNRVEYIDLPFYIGKINIWLFRDILYLALFLSMVLEFVALWWWE